MWIKSPHSYMCRLGSVPLGTDAMYGVNIAYDHKWKNNVGRMEKNLVINGEAEQQQQLLRKTRLFINFNYIISQSLFGICSCSCFFPGTFAALVTFFWFIDF